MKLSDKIRELEDKIDRLDHLEELSRGDQSRLDNYHRRRRRLYALAKMDNAVDQREFNTALLDYLFLIEGVE